MALDGLDDLYQRLSVEERDDLLRRLLLAATGGQEIMVGVLEHELHGRIGASPLGALEPRSHVPEERRFVVGADGCAGGWFAVSRDLENGEARHRCLPDFRRLLDWFGQAAVIAVDMPIGLTDQAQKGGRPVDGLARACLQPYRGSSVFPAPCRPALACQDYAEAAAATRSHSEGGRSLTKQTFALFPKLREVDGCMTPEHQERLREIHPELSFTAMNGGWPLHENKKTPEGRARRIELLRRAGFQMSEDTLCAFAKNGVEKHDILDAYAACWTAARIARGEAEQLGGDLDSRGLRMEIWF